MEIIDNHKDVDKLSPLKEYINTKLEKFGDSDLYHYTTIEALYNGILRKDPEPNKEICLRATSALYLNDPEEIKIGLSFIEKLLYGNSGGKRLNKQSDIMDTCSEYFITSFSQDGDNLPMWNMYAANAAGIALRFDKEIMKDDSWLKCIYYDEKIQVELENILGKFENVETDNKEADEEYEKYRELAIFVLILIFVFVLRDEERGNKIISEYAPIIMFAFSLKHSSYSYEKEVRLMSTISDKDEIKHRFKNNLIIPYLEKYFPKSALKEIIVGPNNDMERTIYSLEKYLKHIGFNHVKVIPSKVPYRG